MFVRNAELENEEKQRTEYERRCAINGLISSWSYLKGTDGSTYAGCICPGCVARLVTETRIVSWEIISREDWAAIVAPAGES